MHNDPINRPLTLLARTTLACVLLATVALPVCAATYTGLAPGEFMKRWSLLGPIPIAADASPDDAKQKEAFAADLLASAMGETGARPTPDATIAIAGKDYRWRLVESTNNIIDLKVAKTPEAFSVAYAWAEIDMPEATRGLLGLGSDDAVKVWLNGQPIHTNWIGRGPRPDDDAVPINLGKGKNQLLLKIQNMEGEWGFVARLMDSEGKARKIISAARNGDIDAAKLLLDQGVDVNSRNAAGLTAVQAAKLRGQTEMVGFLASKGADSSAPIPPPEKLVDALFSSLFKPNGPGSAVLVAKDGKVLLEKGYGLGDVEHDVPVKPETKFRIGSITKQFTAAAILKLYEEGKLSPDDKLSKFIPDYPRGNEVTIHHLLTHTSGIHSYTSKPDFMESVTKGVELKEHIKSFQNDPYDFDPGKKWSYNNSGYFLLGFIIESVAGKSYAEYLTRTFFEPIGMQSTGVHEATGVQKPEAIGYSFEDGAFKKALDWDMSKAGGAGALYSTVGDLYRWNEALFSGKVLKDSTLKTAFTPVKVDGEDPAETKDSGYGYGWGIQKLRGLREISHSGGLHGFSSCLIRLTNENFTVAVLANCAPPLPGVDTGGLAREIAEFYLAEKLAPRETPSMDLSVSAESLDAIVGRYDYQMGILTVTREGKKVLAQLTGQPAFEIYPRSSTNFFWKVVEAEVTFVKDAEGQVIKAIHKQGGQTINAPKLQNLAQAKVDSSIYDVYAGRYDYGGGKSILTVTREGDRLFAQLTGQPKFEIFPKSETEFFWKVVNAQVLFVKDDAGKVTKAVHEQSGHKFDAPRIE